MTSIIIPAYNSETVITETLDRICAVLKNEAFEIIIVNDGSRDATWKVVKDYANISDCVKAVDLLYNHGQHTAILCGMALAKGDYLLTMDDDLQNPPEEIPKLLNKIREGYDLVFARFERKMHARHRRLGSILVGYLNKKIFGKPDDIVLTNFRIFTNETAQRALQYRTKYPYIPGLLLMSAGRIANVTTSHMPREKGHPTTVCGKFFNYFLACSSIIPLIH